MAAAPAPPLLTPRQIEVLELMARGLTNREIAESLGISAATVKNHVSAVIQALDVTNRTEATTALHELGLGSSTAVAPDQTVPGFGARPAIAVLPFDNLSDDPEQAFLADAIADDLVTRLAGWRWFPVISRGSTLAYRGQAVDVKAVCRELGARYLIEGSVRRAGSRVRITAQVIDGDSGQHVLAERYDRELEDVFAVEDEIVDTLVTTLEPALARISGVHLLGGRPDELGLWECLQRGFAQLVQSERGAAARARPLFARAAALDPENALTHTGLAFAEVMALILSETDARRETVSKVIAHARRAVEIDPRDAIAHLAVAFGHLFSGDPRSAESTYAYALELNPSVAWGHAGVGVSLCAQSPPRAPEGEAALERAIRLAPKDPMLPYFLSSLGNALSLQGRFEEAIAAHRRSQAVAPGLAASFGGLASALVAVGRLDEASATLERMRAEHPGWDPVEEARVYVPAEVLPLYRDALLAAGWTDPGSVRER